MAARDNLVEWYDAQAPFADQLNDWVINTTNRIAEGIKNTAVAIAWLIWKIICGLVWAGIRLNFIAAMMLAAYLATLYYLDEYPEPIEHPSGNVVFSRDRCFIQGIEYPEYIAWCKSQHPLHQPNVEIINVTNW